MTCHSRAQWHHPCTQHNVNEGMNDLSTQAKYKEKKRLPMITYEKWDLRKSDVGTWW